MGAMRSRILMVGDHSAPLSAGRSLLQSHYDVFFAPSAAQCFTLLEAARPDLVVLDADTPGGGYETLTRLKTDARSADVPVVFLTAQSGAEGEMRGLELGAADCVCKPFSPLLLQRRIEQQLLLTRQRAVIRSHADSLSVQVSEKILEITSLQSAIISTLADLVEFRDHFTGGHIARTQLYFKALMRGLEATGHYADIIARWDIDAVLQSAQLHDVGKIAIPDAILNKPGPLTAREYDIMKTHVEVGIRAIEKIVSKTVKNAFLRHTRSLIGTHHEKWDGSGYPCGLRGEEIPLEGRLMAVADVYDALVSRRAYKEGMTHEAAKKIIVDGRGAHFDPLVVDAFLHAEADFEKISALDAASKHELVFFTKDMEIGVDIIDRQHRELIERLGELAMTNTAAVPRDKAAEMLDFLGHYITKHFTDEEMLQKLSEYPKFEGHKKQHALFVAHFAALQKRFAEQGFTEDFAAALRDSLTDRLITHIRTVDLEFGRYYQIRSTSLDGFGEMVASS